jgi:Isopropylmalate/homocitrate/citramalate synthases
VSKSDYKAIVEICKLNLGAKIFTFSRALKGDIDMAVDCGANGVVIEIPLGYPKLKYQFGWTWENVLEKSIECVDYAKSQGLYTVYFPYDTTRARVEDLENVLGGLMKHTPPDSVGVVDTMGCALPAVIGYLVKKVKKITGLPVEIHTHNDFGMGVAAEIEGIIAGAECVHSCIGGLGERTGNAALEELMMVMKLMLGLENDYKLEELPALCEYVAKVTGTTFSPNKPIVGERNYVRESGIGVDLVLKEPLAMFATNPKYFGRSGEIVLGKKSGRASVEYMLSDMGITGCNEEQIMEMLNQVKALGIEKRRLLVDEEFRKIVERVTGK